MEGAFNRNEREASPVFICNTCVTTTVADVILESLQ
jgi:hypothetical protein